MKKRMLVGSLVWMLLLFFSKTQPGLAYEYFFDSNEGSDFGKASSVEEEYLWEVPEKKEKTRNQICALPNQNYFDQSEAKEGDFVSFFATGKPAQMLPQYEVDGSLGWLKVPAIGLKTKVYEGETIENMRKGVGHFTSTSSWDGNVAFAGHNRGSNAYFARVKELKKGDVILYTTRYGQRSYQVFRKDKISNTDSSALGWTETNTLTLITCVENEPWYRWCVQARQVK